MAASETTNWLGPNISFWLMTLLVLGSAAAAVFSRSIVRAAYSLFFTLLGMAGFYVLLGSGFLAVTQVIIYVGGILVLLMFGILLTERPLSGPQPYGRWYLAGSGLAAALLTLLLGRIALSTQWQTVPKVEEPVEAVFGLGGVLLDQYSAALEICGVALLVCLVGAAYLVRRREV